MQSASTLAYQYDDNGNLTRDDNKGITLITYNYLNLPQEITFTGGRSLQFVYDAGGAKLRKIANNNGTLTTTDYVNGTEYLNTTLQRIAHTEGSVTRQTDGSMRHEYVLRDHLGNTRVTFTDADNDGVVTASDIKQMNHHYPFGLNMEGNWNGASGENKYGYNGKEWNDDFGLGLNDYGARFYDPAMARWTTADPMADFRSWVSPYQYVQNNPINRIDPTGMIDQKGADGLTNDQWINANRSADGGQTGRMNTSRQGNRDAEVEHQRDLANKGMSRDVNSSDITASALGENIVWEGYRTSEVDVVDGFHFVDCPTCPKNKFTGTVSNFHNGLSFWDQQMMGNFGTYVGVIELNSEGAAAKMAQLYKLDKWNMMKAPYQYQFGSFGYQTFLKKQAQWANRVGVAGKILGRGFAAYGAVTTVADWHEGKKSGTRAFFDLGMTAVGVWGGPWGLAVSGGYFIGMTVYDYYQLKPN